MKPLKRTAGLLFVLCALLTATGPTAAAQQTGLYSVAPYPLEITCQKTTSITFPFAIVSVDKGSRVILAQKARGLENILLLKAAAPDFEQSNLTVVTGEGKLYSFLVDYAAEPSQLTLGFSASLETAAIGAQPSQGYNPSEIQAAASLVSKQPKVFGGLRAKSGGVSLSLTGIYIRGDLMYFQVQCQNRSPVSYDIESIRFLSCQTRQPRRAAVQQIEIHPVQVHNDSTRIAANSTLVKVFTLPKMTMAPGKKLQIHMSESGGGRHLSIRAKNKALLNVRPI